MIFPFPERKKKYNPGCGRSLWPLGKIIHRVPQAPYFMLDNPSYPLYFPDKKQTDIRRLAKVSYQDLEGGYFILVNL
jgi:hypothetical protein